MRVMNKACYCLNMMIDKTNMKICKLVVSGTTEMKFEDRAIESNENAKSW